MTFNTFLFTYLKYGFLKGELNHTVFTPCMYVHCLVAWTKPYGENR